MASANARAAAARRWSSRGHHALDLMDDPAGARRRRAPSFRQKVRLPVDVGEAHARGLRRKLFAQRLGIAKAEALDGGVNEPVLDVLPRVSAQFTRDSGPRRVRQPGAAQLAENVALEIDQTSGGWA